MTKKHFQAIADAVSSVRATYADEDHTADFILDKMAAALANVCAAENPNFDRERFLRACKA